MRRSSARGERPHLRYAARGRLQAELRAVQEEAGCEGVAGTGGIDDLGRLGRMRASLAVRSDLDAIRPAFDHQRRCGMVAQKLSFGLVREHDVGFELVEQTTESIH